MSDAQKYGEWQPIETAPKGPLCKYMQTGPSILLTGLGRVSVGYWKQTSRTRAWCDTLGRMPCEPTHWMPLPEPPK